jgi:hypothetical protein
MKFLIVAVLVSLIALYAVQPRARLIFPEGTNGSLPVCPALLRVGTQGAEFRTPRCCLERFPSLSASLSGRPHFVGLAELF